MGEADNTKDIRWDFLTREYDFLADYLKTNYEERDRYINFYTAILTAIVAAAGFAIDKSSWTTVFLLAIMSTVLSYFTLLKVLYQRVVVTEYKNHLNLTRGKLCELARCESDIRSILLPTTASVKYLKTSGGDAALHRILETVAGVSASAAVYMAMWWLLRPAKHTLLLSCGIALAIFLLIVVSLEIKWRGVLRERDMMSKTEPRELTGRTTSHSS